MDIIIFGGQSNMQGQTECLPEPNGHVEGAFEYLYLKNCLIPLCHPVGENIEIPDESDNYLRDIMAGMLGEASKSHGSLVPDFCRSYIEQTGRSVVAIHAAKGATKICEWLPGTRRYDVAMKKILGGIKAAKQIESVEKIYYVWLQGESDAIDGDGTSEDNYRRMLTEYKNALVHDAGIDKFAIIRVGYFTVDTPERDEAIMRAQDGVCESETDCVMLTTMLSELCKNPEYINPNARAHFNNKAMTLIGKAAGKRLGELRAEE